MAAEIDDIAEYLAGNPATLSPEARKRVAAAAGVSLEEANKLINAMEKEWAKNVDPDSITPPQ